MSGPAVLPATGWRRESLGGVLGLVAFLLFAQPIFLLGPLAILLALSRPGTLREWWWLAGCGAWLAVAIITHGGIADQVVTAWGIMISGVLAAVVLGRPRPFASAALLTLGIAVPALALWGWKLGIGWRDFELAVAHEGWSFCRALLKPAEDGTVDPARIGLLAPYLATLAGVIFTESLLFPALTVLTSLVGLALAWTWYHRIARRPLGLPPGAFADFRFSDHLVWGAVLGMAMVVLIRDEPWANLGANLVVFFGGLYAARGAAVARSAVRRMSVGLLLLVVVGVLFLFPVALGGLISLGLADTWLDFRRRFGAPHLGES